MLINKPLEWTSFDVVSKVRNMLKPKFGRLKVGHAGTLDPLATGLLIICTGSFTKQISQFQDMEKEYEGVITLGAFRPSFDKETGITETSAVPPLTPEIIEKASQSFTGEIEQVPPAHSAIKVDGKRAYEKAHKGIEVEMKPRKVFIKSLEAHIMDETHLGFKVVCSKGTYIRSLARDYGKALGTSAYLEELCRTRIGDFNLSEAATMEELNVKLS